MLDIIPHSSTSNYIQSSYSDYASSSPVMYRDRHTNPPCNWLVIPQCYCTNTLTYVHTQTHTHSHSDTVEPVYPRVSYNMVIIGLYRGMAALQRYRLQCFSAMLVLFGAREAVRFREVTALHSDCLRQDPQYTYTHKHSYSHTERIACSKGLFHISSLCKHAILMHSLNTLVH